MEALFHTAAGAPIVILGQPDVEHQPYQSQTTAEIRYALHDSVDMPAAWWLIHIVRTCAIIIIDAPCAFIRNTDHAS
jgi:hypothetical protein